MNLLSRRPRSEISKEMRGYGGRPLHFADGGKAGIRSLSADILQTSGLNESRYGEKAPASSISYTLRTTLQFRGFNGTRDVTN